MKQASIILVIVLCLVQSKNLSAQQKVFRAYVDQYSSLAVSEMHRTGIPASIKLAQGLLESNAGRSELATKANNHFGIKCGGDWTGKTYHKEDDDYQNGKLVKSCFRSFASVHESYIAHSEFLRNPSKSSRYGFLFNLSSTDYKGWAHGLKKAGYATAPTYAQKLIKIIEDYELHQYDKEVVPMDMPVIANVGAGGKKKSPRRVTLPQKSVFNNSSRMVYAMADETVEALAKRHKVSVDRILKYNEGLNSSSQKLTYGERVYLSTKRNFYRGQQKLHYVQANETMYSISQLYGVKLSKLLFMNRMKPGEEPAVGEQLVLRGRVSKVEAPILKTQKENILPKEPELTNPDPDHLQFEEELPDDSLSFDTQTTMSHEVAPGDTLFGIARKYNVTVEGIRQANNLEDNNIRVGQRLVLPK